MVTQLNSNIDSSVNFIEQTDKGYFESRYVNRDNGYFICYLSSYSGCNQGCKMCHLTATKQVNMTPASLSEYSTQAEKVFRHAKELDITGKVHINFMARGEPLLNKHILSGTVFEVLDNLCEEYGLVPTYNISTIFPRQNENFYQRFEYDYFGQHCPVIYYSYYSDKEKFRKKWLPRAIPAWLAFSSIRGYYSARKVKSKIHFALIKGENDSQEDFRRLACYVNSLNFSPQINIVRYNSPDDSEESDKIEEFTDFILANTDASVYTVPRVGFDIKASCGMFVS